MTMSVGREEGDERRGGAGGPRTGVPVRPVLAAGWGNTGDSGAGADVEGLRAVAERARPAARWRPRMALTGAGDPAAGEGAWRGGRDVCTWILQ
jgi:hypothetical protein